MTAKCDMCQPLPAKAQAIVDAASRLFLQNGYGQTSMDAIAQEAGVAKQTLYSHFENKEDLIKAIVTRRCSAIADTLNSPESVSNVEKALLKLAEHMTTILMKPESLNLYRLVVAESPRLPSLGETFFESGPNTGIGRLAAFLQTAHDKGTLDVPNPTLAAQYFFGMLMQYPHMQSLLLGKLPAPAELEARRKETVQAFLKMFTKA